MKGWIKKRSGESDFHILLSWKTNMTGGTNVTSLLEHSKSSFCVHKKPMQAIFIVKGKWVSNLDPGVE